MRIKVGLVSLVVAAASLVIPATARAEVFLSPFVGVTFGGQTTVHKPVVGASATLVGRTLSLEVEYGYVKDFFGSTPAANVSNLSVSLVGGADLHGRGAKPYFVAGVGLLRSDASGTGIVQNAHYNDFALNLAAGVNVLFSDHIGVRSEVRYFRRLEKSSDSGLPIATNFGFFRGLIGLDFHFD